MVLSFSDDFHNLHKHGLQNWEPLDFKDWGAFVILSAFMGR